LKVLRDAYEERKPGEPVPTLAYDVLYNEFGNCHNIHINENTGFLYCGGGDTCQSGPHIVDINNPGQPEFAGCFDLEGYSHDVECVTYTGPHTEYQGREICFAFNEDAVTIVDVTDKAKTTLVGKSLYSGSQYTHQGWATSDQKYLLVNDELDESCSVDYCACHQMGKLRITEPADQARELVEGEDFFAYGGILDPRVDPAMFQEFSPSAVYRAANLGCAEADFAGIPPQSMVFVDARGCGRDQKAINARTWANASAVVLINYEGGPIYRRGSCIDIPTYTMGWDTANAILGSAPAGQLVMSGASGALDAVVALGTRAP
jgi:hypothetical protein